MSRSFIGGLAALVTFAGPAAASALAITTAKAPEAEAKPFLQWIITIVVCGAIGAITFKNGKRTPHD